MNEIRISKNTYSHCNYTDKVLIVYLNIIKENGKNYFYVCDKNFGIQESKDGQCYIVKTIEKGKSE